MDLGAILILNDPNNPLLKIAQDNNVKLFNVDFMNKSYYTDTRIPSFLRQSGISKQFSTSKMLKRLIKSLEKFKLFLKNNFHQLQENTVENAVNAYIKKKLKSSIDKLLIKFLVSVYNFSSKKKKLSSVIKEILNDSLFFGGECFITPDGYIKLLKPLSDLLNIRLETVIKSVIQQDGRVYLYDQNNQEYISDYVIITVPLGYLKKNLITFSPPLSEEKRKAIQEIGFFNMNKILMEFEENFWGKSQYYTILIEPLILSLNFNFELVSGKNLLISFISEDDYDKIKYLNMQDLQNLILKQLQSVFPGKYIKIKNFYKTNWNEDPFTFGSFTEYGVAEDLRQKFISPEGNLIFAGEHTTLQYNSFVNGAYLSGLRAANQIINGLK